MKKKAKTFKAWGFFFNEFIMKLLPYATKKEAAFMKLSYGYGVDVKIKRVTITVEE